MIIEETIREELKSLKTKLCSKYKKTVFGIGNAIIVFLWICVVFFGAFECKDFMDKVAVVIGIGIVGFVIEAAIYFYSIRRYQCIKVNKINYCISSFKKKEHNPGYTDYLIEDHRGKARHFESDFYLYLSEESFRRKTFSWVYRNVQIDKRYIIVFSGDPSRKNSKIIYVKEA